MLATIPCLRIRSTIKEIKKLNNKHVALGTSLHGVRIFSFDKCQVDTTISHESLNANTSAISFSPNAEFMAFTNESYIFVLHIPSQIVLKKIKTDSTAIEHLEFDLESKYIIASSADGRILQYRYDGSSLIGRLYSFETENLKTHNKASSFAFYNTMMACGGDNGTILYINLYSRANKAILTNANLKINSLCFVDANHILSGDRKGDLYLNSLKDNSLIKKQESVFRNVKQVVLMPNEKNILVSGDENFIAVYDAKTLKLLHSKYIEFNDIPTKVIVADKNTLIVTLQDNTVHKVQLPNAKKLNALIISNDLDKAYQLVKLDPLLRDTKEYQILELAYSKIYQQALDALIKQNKNLALKLTNIFKYIDEKQQEIQLLFKSFENYSRFRTLFAEKKYALAYAMCNKFPPLMQTFQYIKMEETWNEALNNAQRQMSHSQKENAMALLGEYATVTQKRPLIKLILQYNSEYTEFLKAIRNKDFKSFIKITKNNSLFTFIPAYENIKEEMKKSLDSIQRDIHKCELDSAVEQLSKLQNIESLANEVTLQKNECIALKKLQDAYKLNDFNKCFETIDKYNSLNATQLGILLQNHWLKTISKCEDFALKGSVKDIKETLGDLIGLSSRRDKIGDLFRLAFHTKIKGLLHKKLYKKAESIIYSYIDIFGIDTEIHSIMKLYEVKSGTTLAITQGSRVERDKWLNSPLIMS